MPNTMHKTVIELYENYKIKSNIYNLIYIYIYIIRKLIETLC